ncbi:hypothetical protein [Nitrospira sp. Nam80]
MPAAHSIHAILARPDTLSFPSNRPYARQLDEHGGQVLQLPGGHYVVYGGHGRRLLLADPDGNPLHECDWGKDEKERDILIRARVRLDWGQWVGIKPGGLANTTTLNLSTRPGWQRLRADDLRHMAARAMQVPVEEVRCFYGEEDLLIDPHGTATIRHRKDALYVLEDGAFKQCRFMACMGAMHWGDIDFLPVVELFQSLLPGTGSAVFELIRGLYDDQNAGRPAPRALRYRGIPTYPSDAAFRLFSAFFTARAPRGEQPFPLFMDPPRSHEVTWLPAADYPRRYVGAGGICVTVKQHIVEKVTLSDDGAGLSYLAPTSQRPAPCERTVEVNSRELILNDRGLRTKLAIDARWGPLIDTSGRTGSAAPVQWSDLFSGTPPQLTGREAFSAVHLYPEDDTEIGELASQPFVVDYLQDLIDQDAPTAAMVSRADRALVHLFDGAIGGCIDGRRVRDYTVIYRSGPFAQKQAQMIWNRFASLNRLPWLQRIRMCAVDEPSYPDGPYDLVYEWIPFPQFELPGQIHAAIETLARRIASGGIAFVVGPGALEQVIRLHNLVMESGQAVTELPPFQMHQSILPKARLKANLTLYRIRRP